MWRLPAGAAGAARFPPTHQGGLSLGLGPLQPVAITLSKFGPFLLSMLMPGLALPTFIINILLLLFNPYLLTKDMSMTNNAAVFCLF